VGSSNCLTPNFKNPAYEAFREFPFEGFPLRFNFFPLGLLFSAWEISTEFAFKNAITFADFEAEYLFID